MIERYNKFSSFLKKKYGEKVWKISLDAGLSCPNCKGAGKEGCIYCRNDSFSRRAFLQHESIHQQMQSGIDYAKRQLGVGKYIAYFQASTNTFGSANLLKEYYESSLQFDGVVGVSISTRPDCLPPSIISVINDLTSKTDVWIELGLQSSHDVTLDFINRGHTYNDFLTAIKKLAKLKVRICAHIMLGLPGEGPEEVKTTAERIAKLSIHEVKLHPLLILKETTLAQLFSQEKFGALSLQQYTEMVVSFIELLSPDIVLQRLTAEAPKEMLIAPEWTMNKLKVLNSINREFEKRNSCQGKFYQD